MTLETPDLKARVDHLERSVRRTTSVAAVAGVALLATWVMGAARHASPQPQDEVRTKLLVIQDSQGRDRIVIGAPMPDPRQYVGMKILDPGGAEQFGLGLRNDGSISMGFDAKPGVGNPANRERLNMGVTPKGPGLD
jgi:hypothetical protein